MSTARKFNTTKRRKSVTISARVDPATARALDRLAAAHNRSRSWVLNEAIRAQATAEAEYLAAIDKGLQAAEAGRLIADADLDEALARRRAASRKRAA